MRRKLKQTAAVLSLMGSAYLGYEAMKTGLENYGVQYDKVATTEIDQAEIEELSADSKRLTRISVTYLAGSVALLASSGWVGIKLSDETIARKQTELTIELSDITNDMRHQANSLFNSNRMILNGISEHDLHQAEFEADHQVKV